MKPGLAVERNIHKKNYHGMSFKGDDLKVMMISPESPADGAGINVGDQLVAINGVTMKGASEAIDVIKLNVGKPLVLTLQRDGKNRDHELTPEDYYSKIAPSSDERLERLKANWDPLAALVLGRLYDLGEGVEQDFDEAEKWYRRSMYGGNPKATYYLADMALRTDDETRPIALHLERLEDAAYERVPEAALRLGRLYLGEAGVTRSDKAAYRWLTLAATAGVVEAEELLTELRSAVSDEERDEIQDWTGRILKPIIIEDE